MSFNRASDIKIHVKATVKKKQTEDTKLQHYYLSVQWIHSERTDSVNVFNIHTWMGVGLTNLAFSISLKISAA